MTEIAIIGTGLIGTSIGLALKQSNRGRDIRITGVDADRQRANAAKRLGAVDETEPRASRAVRDASIVILAVPIIDMRDTMEEIAPDLLEGAIVTDVGSSKAEILRWADAALPETAHFVGGHPMAGRTESGPDAADAQLFEGARWAIVPSAKASTAAVETVRGLVETLGATVMYMDAEEHDAYVAAVSHLPLMAATALFKLARGSEAWPELSMLAAGGFRDTTRLAGTEEGLSTDIVLTNRDQVVHWLRRYRRELLELEELIDDPEREEEVYRLFAATNMQYVGFRSGAIGRTEIDEKGDYDVPGVGELLLGAHAAERMRQITQRAEEREAERQPGKRFGRPRP